MRLLHNLSILITILYTYTEESCAAPKNVAEIGSLEKRETETTIPSSNATVLSQNTNKELSNNRNTYKNGVDIGNNRINNMNRSVARRSIPLPKSDVKQVFDYDDHQIAMTKAFFGSTHAATKFVFSTWTTPMALYDDALMWTTPNNNITTKDPQLVINSTMEEKILRSVWSTITDFSIAELEIFLKEKLKKWKVEYFTPEKKTYMILAFSALVVGLFCWVFAVYWCCHNLILQVRQTKKIILDSETTKCDPEKCPYGKMK